MGRGQLGAEQKRWLVTLGHPFLAQGDNARSVESGRAALLIPFHFAASMPASCRSRMKPSFHLGNHALHGQHHAAHRPAGVDGRPQHPAACAFLFKFVHEIENVPRVPA